MPRRRALRLAAGLVAGAAVPGMRAGRAAARPTPGKCLDPSVPVNCGRIYPDQPNGNDWCCAKQSDCYRDPKTGQGGKCCAPEDRCGKWAGCCDNPGFTCKGGECVYCAEENRCGKACCDAGEYCGSKKRGLCCQNGHDACVVSGGAAGLCCRPGTTCCFSAKTARCCDSKHPCVKGRCKCGKDEKPCGDHCCTKGEVCSGGKCCPTGQFNCGGKRCCPKGTSCCGEECCAKGEVCSDGKCCPKGEVKCGEKCCPKDNACCSTPAGERCCKRGEPCAPMAGSPGNRTCCPKSRIAIFDGRAVCCPSGAVATPNDGCCPPGKPNCCPEDLQCLGNRICVDGECVAAR